MYEEVAEERGADESIYGDAEPVGEASSTAAFGGRGVDAYD